MRDSASNVKARKIEILCPGTRTREEILDACKTMNIEPISVEMIEPYALWQVTAWFYPSEATRRYS